MLCALESSGTHSLRQTLNRQPVEYVLSLDCVCRNMLCAVESSGTHGLRLTLTRQLAEVLLRGYTGTRYTPPGTSLYMHRSDIELQSALLTLTCNTLNVIGNFAVLSSDFSLSGFVGCWAANLSVYALYTKGSSRIGLFGVEGLMHCAV
ncbi:hypothetical protein J6590_062213 [Homalodisca vitripennis]|nr:hypothetical protein J6590_062213 [Homalodisca vitripennis]